MSKQRMARAIRKGARHAQARYFREVRPQIPLDAVTRGPRRWPYALAIAVALGIALFARCAAAAGPRACASDALWDLGLGILLFAAYVLTELGAAVAALLTYLFKKGPPS